MAEKRVAVELVGRDSLSPTFKKVGASATAAGKDIDTAGKSVGRLEQASSRFSKTGAAMGAALGALSGIMADAARKSMEAEISNERLRTSIEATGATYEEFADQLERAGDAAVQMGFDDEDAADAISRLTQSTGDAQTAINDLGLAMDIARGRGIALADATRIIEYVETGRMESLRRLGIVLDENASKEEALAELQRRYAGQAEAYSKTTAGFYDKVQVQFENLQESLGEHAGALQTVLVLLPGLSAGWVLASSALGGLATAMGLTNASAVGLLGSLTRLGGARLGIGIGLAAVAADLVLAAEAGENSAELFKKSAEGVDLLRVSVDSLAATSANGALVGMSDDVAQSFEQIDRLATKYDELEQKWAEGTLTGEESAVLDHLASQFGNVADAALLSGDALIAADAILNHTGASAKDAQEQLAVLDEQFDTGQITVVEYYQGVIDLGNSLGDMDREARSAAEGVSKFTTASESATEAAENWKAVLLDFKREQFATAFDAVTSAYTATTDALNSGFRAIVGNTNAVGAQAKAVSDWATELINVKGEQGQIDALLKSGALDQRDYNQAQEAYNLIAGNTAAIQEDILSIQAQQAPVIAKLTAEQAVYWDALANQPEDVQRLALAYMDTDTAAQALSLTQTALAGAPSGFEKIVEGAIRANPLLEDILEDMGVISVGSDGTVTIKTEGKSELESLTEAIDRLVQAEWVAMFSGDVTQAEAAYEDATGLMVDWDGQEAEATLLIEDNATGVLNNALSLINQLDGRSVLTYVTTTYRSTGIMGAQAYEHGGTAKLTEAAHGLTATLVGERGPELLMLPGGAQVMNTEATGSRTGNWGGGNIVINISGNVYGMDDLTEQVTRELVPAIQRAAGIHRKGYGL